MKQFSILSLFASIVASTLPSNAFAKAISVRVSNSEGKLEARSNHNDLYDVVIDGLHATPAELEKIQKILGSLSDGQSKSCKLEAEVKPFSGGSLEASQNATLLVTSIEKCSD